MTKYTINKAFEKVFDNPIWKIEVDTPNETLAIECRNLENTFPTFHVYSFGGKEILKTYTVEEKEWALEAIQGNFLILKKIGVSSPIQAGIKIINIITKTEIASFAEYVIKAIYKDTIVALHRNIPSGLLFYINISSGQIKNSKDSPLQPIDNLIAYPNVYEGKLPAFMNHISEYKQLWLQAYSMGFIWTYLQQKDNKYILNLILSSKYQTLTEETIFNSFDRLILQPYFKVKNYIFFLSDTKQKIVTYLV